MYSVQGHQLKLNNMMNKLLSKVKIETGDLRSLWYKWSIFIAKAGISMYNTSNERDHLSLSTAKFIFK